MLLQGMKILRKGRRRILGTGAYLSVYLGKRAQDILQNLQASWCSPEAE